MVVLGCGRFLMSEVPLEVQQFLSSMIHFSVCSHLGSIGEIVSLQETWGSGIVVGVSKGSQSGSYLRLIDVCITQL